MPFTAALPLPPGVEPVGGQAAAGGCCGRSSTLEGLWGAVEEAHSGEECDRSFCRPGGSLLPPGGCALR